MKKSYLGLVLLSMLILGTACSTNTNSSQETKKSTEVSVTQKESIELLEKKLNQREKQIYLQVLYCLQI